MKLQGERTIPANVEQTWTALNDPQTLKACIKGCESIEVTGEPILKVPPRSSNSLTMPRIRACVPPRGNHTPHFFSSAWISA